MGHTRAQWNIIQPSKRKGILTHAVTWINLGDPEVGEISPSQKDKECVIPPTRGIQSSQITGAGRGRVVVSGWEWAGGIGSNGQWR